ncbi:MAG: 6-carboxytetrahydropterin synthase, partial [Terriglobales bacterium]
STDGYVLDFRIGKKIVRQVCTPLDRKILLPGDNETLTIQYSDTTVTACHRQRAYSFPAAEVLVLPLRNTTTELLARYLGNEMLERLRKFEPAIAARELRLDERPDSYADVIGGAVHRSCALFGRKPARRAYDDHHVGRQTRRRALYRALLGAERCARNLS